jgi:hypothetical protein
LKSKPTWPNAFGCWATSAFFVLGGKRCSQPRGIASNRNGSPGGLANVEDVACELYKSLTALDTKPVGPGKISWNLEKFLVGRNGEVVARFAPKTKPDDSEVLKAIEAELAKKG